MANILARAFPPPSNWQDFERLCFDLFARLWQTNDAEMHGRIGQPQFGVDVYGNDRLEKRFVGVQCKGKDQGYHSPLTKAELVEEVKKAKSFVPKLDVFVIATTAANDSGIQAYARELSEKNRTDGLFEVRVQGWTTLRQKITDYPDLVEKYFSDLAPIDLIDRINKSDEAIRDQANATREFVQNAKTELLAAIEKVDPSDKLQVRIEELAKLTDNGSPSAALRALERLWTHEGPNASSRNRYRIRANIGFAYLIMGNKRAAIENLRSAFNEDPEWPNARAILATAELLDGDRQKAFALANEALRIDSECHRAVCVQIETAPASYSLHELASFVPVALAEKFDIQLLLADQARVRGDLVARKEYLERAAQLRPNDWRVLAANAEILLEPIFAQDGIALTHIVASDQANDLNSAIELLQRAWSQLLEREDAQVGAYVGANLLSALELSGRKEDFERTITEALKVAPTFQPFLQRYAKAMVDADDWSSAKKALDAIPADSLEPIDRLLKIQALIHTGNPAEALNQARQVELEFQSVRDKEVAAGLQIEASIKAGSVAGSLEAILERWPRSVVLRAAAHNLLSEDDPRKAVLLNEITDLTDGIKDAGDRWHAAEALYAAKQYSRAADMYKGLYAPDRESQPLYRAIRSLLLSGRRRDARTLFESLDQKIKSNPRYGELGVAIYERSGLLKEARQILEELLTTDGSIRRRNHWIQICERIGDIENVKRWLQEVPSDVNGTPQELMALALAIDRILGVSKSLAVGYRALRAGYSDPQIHLAYTIGLMLTGAISRQSLKRPKIVSLDTAVLLSEKDGERTLVRVLETDLNPIIERDEINPSTELGPNLLGHQVGDEIEVPGVGIAPIVYVIEEIRDKYLHAHFRSLGDFERLFPGSKAFGSFKIDETKGEDRFKPIFESVKRRGEFALKLADTYRKGKLPLALLAKIAGVSPFDTWDWVVSQKDMEFRTCAGPTQELDGAKHLLTQTRKAIIDPITLYGLVRLNIEKRVRACFDDVGVVQTTIDLFRRFLWDRTQDRGSRRGVLSWDGEHYQAVELEESIIESQIKIAESVLAFAESLTLLPSEPLEGALDDGGILSEEIDPAFLDTLYAAQGAKRLLLCDDYIFRSVGQELAGVGGVWTQAVSAFGAERGRISADDYHEIVAALVTANYQFTAVNNQNILFQLSRDRWQITPVVEAFCSQISLPTNDPKSVVGVISDLIQFGWKCMPERAAFVRFFSALFDSYRRQQPQSNIEEIVDLAFSVVHTRIHLPGFSKLLCQRLLLNTSLVPPARAFKSSKISSDNFFSRIAGALREALDGNVQG